MSDFSVDRIRQDFPILTQQVRGKPLVYLDNAATTQKPLAVIETINQFYRQGNANVHRGIHSLSEQATAAYENVRHRVRDFIHAPNSEDIVFVKGVTDGINLVAQSYGRTFIKAGDEIVITAMEHHANIVPWQMLCEQVGAVLRVVPVSDEGVLDLEAYEKLLNPKTKLVAMVHISNVLGTVNPVKQMVELAHQQDIPVLVDGAQAAPHQAIDVQDIDCDFYLFSAHKMCGPTGVGVLYAKSHWLEQMPPYQGGGDMISQVSFEHSEYQKPPHKFEAGTPNIAGVIGMGAAIDYIESVGLEAIGAHEKHLLHQATKALSAVSGLKIIGTAPEKAAVIAFTLDGVHPHDIATLLDNEGVAVRAGHHCAMPLMQRFGVPATARASFAMYNTESEIEALVKALNSVQEMFQA